MESRMTTPKPLLSLIDTLEDVQIHGEATCLIHGLASHSSDVKKGFLFFVKKGSKVDAKDHLEEALRKGAKALVLDTPLPLPLTQIIHPDPGALEGPIASAFYDHPSKHLNLIGITGTNGKTTTAFWTKHLLSKLQGITGFIGTLYHDTGTSIRKTVYTTPFGIETQNLLHKMRQNGCQSAVMEVSSHALDQNRTKGLTFSHGVFTNLSQDHLDYHRTMEAYFNAKKELFTALSPSAHAILNQDSPYYSKLLTATKARITTYSQKEKADLAASILAQSLRGMEVTLNQTPTFIPVIGTYNLSNLIAAIATCMTLGFPLSSIVSHLKSLPSPKGRLERIPNQKEIHCFVDYAHTEDGLHCLLSTLRELKLRKLVVVFGAGGDRDAKKRPFMGAAAEKWADHSILTSDNPRGESPEKIIQEIAGGYKNPSHYTIEVDRENAIKMALTQAKKGDIVVIAGKGHETTQTIKNQTIPFDDRIITQNILESTLQLK